MKIQIELCMGSSCFARGNSRILSFLDKYLDKEDLAGQVDVKGHLCMGNCSNGPVVRINKIDYFNLKENEMIRIVEGLLYEQ